MKIRALTSNKTKMRLLPIASVLALVCLYQSYWLMSQYNELRDRLYEDIQEALRSSDFEELVHRVDEISRMKEVPGSVSVSAGYDPEKGKSFVKSEVTEQAESEVRDDNSMTVSPSSLGSVLKNPEDLKKVGLNMQRGIHSGIDGIKEINMSYLDKRLTAKLRALGLDGEHRLLYLQKKRSEGKVVPGKEDTLERIGNTVFEAADIFRLEISGDAEYRMAIPQWRVAVLKKMMPVILFSAVTFLLLVLTFLYLIRAMRRQRQLEEIKTDFTNNITHELKTPIAVAYAANDSLLNFDASRNTPRMNRYLKVCQEQLRLLDRLVEQILSLSMERRQSLIMNMEEIRVRELIESIVPTFRIKYPGDVVFEIDADADMMLESDRMHLSNIIGNLIDNAIKYSRGRAIVRIKAYRDKRDQAVIKISDNGIGITGEQQKYIFDKFYRVPHGNIHDVKGYGLGLFYVRSMTEKLGGAVTVRSEYGKGSCFTLKF